jgi:hypothetical protein
MPPTKKIIPIQVNYSPSVKNNCSGASYVWIGRFKFE